MVFTDIRPQITLDRKINDNHTLEEMTSKRLNYISLLKEFSEVKKFLPIENCRKI